MLINAKLGNYATSITNDAIPHGNDSTLGDYAMPHGEDSTLADYDAALGYGSKFGDKYSTLGDFVNVTRNDDATVGNDATLVNNRI
jgi:hypothetical protein